MSSAKKAKPNLTYSEKSRDGEPADTVVLARIPTVTQDSGHIKAPGGRLINNLNKKKSEVHL